MKARRVYACLMRLHFNAVFGKTVLVAIFSLGNTTLPAQHLVINNVDEEPFKEFVLDYDPSAVAISNDHPNAWSPKLYFERWRIITDLNNDGNDDLILSADPDRDPRSSSAAGLRPRIRSGTSGAERYALRASRASSMPWQVSIRVPA